MVSSTLLLPSTGSDTASSNASAWESTVVSASRPVISITYDRKVSGGKTMSWQRHTNPSAGSGGWFSGSSAGSGQVPPTAVPALPSVVTEYACGSNITEPVSSVSVAVSGPRFVIVTAMVVDDGVLDMTWLTSRSAPAASSSTMVSVAVSTEPSVAPRRGLNKERMTVSSPSASVSSRIGTENDAEASPGPNDSVPDEAV